MNPEAIEAAARAMAILDDHDGCFLEVDQWEGREDWEKEAHPDNYPGMAYEDCNYWRGKARAALEAAAPYLIREARAAELEAAAELIYRQARVQLQSSDGGRWQLAHRSGYADGVILARQELHARAVAIRAGQEGN